MCISGFDDALMAGEEYFDETVDRQRQIVSRALAGQ
jgi:hypothetical protein